MKRLLLLPGVMLLLLAGCSQSLYMQGRRASEGGEYVRAVSLFYEEIAANPQNAEAWRDMGVAFYELGNFVKAEDALKQANAIRPDAKAYLYLGLLSEQQDQEDKAIEHYTTSLSLEPKGETRNLIRAHLDRIISRTVTAEVKRALQNEDQIDVASIPENSIAVADFSASNMSPEMAPLARGLAEFTAIDLAKVKQLRVVDRLKIDVIQRELALGASGMVNPSTAPRVGRLVGSRHLVTGAVLGIGDDAIRLDGVLINTADSSAGRTETTEGEIDQLFRLQKDFVFRVIDDLGITLTAEERDAIEEVPTESFLAFLAYSRGLEHQAAGRMGEAEQSFNEASVADPNFGAAAAKVGALSGSAALGGDYSLAGFEGLVLGGTTVADLAAGLDGMLNGVAINIGGLPDFTNFNIAEIPPLAAGYGTVVVEGDVNGQ